MKQTVVALLKDHFKEHRALMGVVLTVQGTLHVQLNRPEEAFSSQEIR